MIFIKVVNGLSKKPSWLASNFALLKLAPINDALANFLEIC
jgi:hypothetical protein